MQMSKYSQLIAQRKFVRLLIADIVSRFGDSLDAIAYSWIMYEITGSESLMALIIGLNYIPTVLFQPLIGAFVDKVKKKNVMVLMDILRAVIVVAVILLYLNHLLSPIILAVLTLLTSTVEAVRMPAGSAFLPMVLEKEYYTLGKAASYSFCRASEIIGYIMVGGLISLIGTDGVLGIDMVTFLVSAFLIFSIKDNESIQEGKMELHGIISGFREGMQFFKEQKTIQLVCLIGLFINFGIMPLSVFQTPYVSDYLLMGPEMLSFIKILMALGMSAGAFIVPKMQRIGNAKMAGTAGVVMGMTLILMYIAPITENLFLRLLITIGAMFLIGAGGGVLNVIIGSCMMKNIPKEMMGRISGFIAATMQVSMPIASFLCSALAYWFKITQIFAVFGVLTIIIYTYMSYTHILRRLNN